MEWATQVASEHPDLHGVGPYVGEDRVDLPGQKGGGHVQDAVDHEPTRRAVADFEGIGTLETWTAPFDRDGRPEKAFLTVRTADDCRALAVVTDPDAAGALVSGEAGDPAGAKVRVDADGTAMLV